MKKEITGWLAGLVCLAAFSSARADLVRNPTAVGADFDFGQIVQGTLINGSSSVAKFNGDKQPMSRTGVYVSESGTYNERLTVHLTVGGLFWYGLPEDNTFQSHRIYFGPGVGDAQGIYAFGSDPKNPTVKLQFGLFPHKYSESVNLGEYLFRSGTYPGAIYTGGWSYMNSAAYMAQGFRLTAPTFKGMLTHDLTFYMERDLEPTNDISPGYLLTAKPTSFLEFGAGVVWAHAISMDGKRLNTVGDGTNNQYSKATERPIQGAIPSDTMYTGDTQAYYVSDTAGTGGNYGKYTFKGFKAMGRVSMDFGELFHVASIRPGEFKLYSEIALLGIENQPFYYEKKSERMPIMGGIKIPTFGLLDVLAFEMEYHKSPFPNNIGSVLEQRLPLPIDNGNPYVYDLDSYVYKYTVKGDTLSGYTVKDYWHEYSVNDPAVLADPVLRSAQLDSVRTLAKNETSAQRSAMKKAMTKDDWKWTVYARRSIGKAVSVYAQAANDHLRHFNAPFAIPAAIPATNRLSDWYYVIRLEIGI